MSICAVCEVRAERPCTYAPRTLEFYKALIAALRYVAHRCGYALAVHGSLKTDIDLLAVPWRENAISQQALAEEIRLTAERIIGHAEMQAYDANPTVKPCGRLAWSFYLQPKGCTGPYIDLSVMPAGGKEFDDKAFWRGGYRWMRDDDGNDKRLLDLAPHLERTFLHRATLEGTLPADAKLE